MDDYERAISLAEKAVEQDEANRQYRSGLGAIQMRAGLYEQALKSLEKSTEVEATSKTSSAYTAYFLGMTQHHLDQVQVARESLAKANQLAEQELYNETKPPSWSGKLTLQLLRTEADVLINEPAAPKVDAHSAKASPQRRDD